MSNVITTIGLDTKLQPQPKLGHGNSNHLATIPRTSHTSSSSSSSKRAPKPTLHLFYDEEPKVEPLSFGSVTPSLIDHEVSNESVTTNESYDVAHEYLHTSPFNHDWVCSQEYVQNRTPSRKDDISYYSELALRRKGTSFIRQVANQLKLKPICKETAYIYFHRFYMLRSFKKYDPCRIALACLYLACKFEDHPAFKEHLVRISFMLIHNIDIKKTDKDYAECCDRLIRDENLLLQVLGFTLQIRHYQVLIVEASQNPVEGTSKDLYTTAYKISSEVNRLTMLCVEYPSPILACVAIYLAAIYKGIALPNDWCATVKGAHDAHLVVRIGEEHKELIAKDSDLVKGILKESGVKCLKPTSAYCSPGDNSRGDTPSHSSFFGRNDHLTSHLLTTFSPDSAYSSNSSHSPPENANYNSHSRTAQAHHNNIHPSHTINQSQAHHKSSQQFTYSPTATNSSSYDLAKLNRTHEVKRTSNNRSVGSSHQVAKNSLIHGVNVNGLSNTQSNSKKRALPSVSSNLNQVDSFFAGASTTGNSDRIGMITSGTGSEVHRKRLKSDHHSISNNKHQTFSGHMHNKVGVTNSSSNRMVNANAGLAFINQKTSSSHYTSMPHF